MKKQYSLFIGFAIVLFTAVQAQTRTIYYYTLKVAIANNTGKAIDVHGYVDFSSSNAFNRLPSYLRDTSKGEEYSTYDLTGITARRKSISNVFYKDIPAFYWNNGGTPSGFNVQHSNGAVLTGAGIALQALFYSDNDLRGSTPQFKFVFENYSPVSTNVDVTVKGTSAALSNVRTTEANTSSFSGGGGQVFNNVLFAKDRVVLSYVLELNGTVQYNEPDILLSAAKSDEPDKEDAYADPWAEDGGDILASSNNAHKSNPLYDNSIYTTGTDKYNNTALDREINKTYNSASSTAQQKSQQITQAVSNNMRAVNNTLNHASGEFEKANQISASKTNQNTPSGSGGDCPSIKCPGLLQKVNDLNSSLVKFSDKTFDNGFGGKVSMPVVTSGSVGICDGLQKLIAMTATCPCEDVQKFREAFIQQYNHSCK